MPVAGNMQIAAGVERTLTMMEKAMGNAPYRMRHDDSRLWDTFRFPERLFNAGGQALSPIPVLDPLTGRTYITDPRTSYDRPRELSYLPAKDCWVDEKRVEWFRSSTEAHKRFYESNAGTVGEAWWLASHPPAKNGSVPDWNFSYREE